MSNCTWMKERDPLCRIINQWAYFELSTALWPTRSINTAANTASRECCRIWGGLVPVAASPNVNLPKGSQSLWLPALKYCIRVEECERIEPLSCSNCRCCEKLHRALVSAVSSLLFPTTGVFSPIRLCVSASFPFPTAMNGAPQGQLRLQWDPRLKHTHKYSVIHIHICPSTQL